MLSSEALSQFEKTGNQTITKKEDNEAIEIFSNAPRTGTAASHRRRGAQQFDQVSSRTKSTTFSELVNLKKSRYTSVIPPPTQSGAMVSFQYNLQRLGIKLRNV